MQYLDSFLHLPDLIPLEEPEQKEIPEQDEDILYQEYKDRRSENDSQNDCRRIFHDSETTRSD